MPDERRQDVARVRAVEERAFNAWPALSTLVAEGWLLRFADGYTKRANSINAWRPAASLSTILPHASTLYAARRLPVIVRLSPLAPPGTDDMLAGLGFARADETIVMTAALAPGRADADGSHVADSAISLSPLPETAWCAGFATANAVPEHRRAIHDRMLAAIPPPAAFASVSEGSGAIGWGLAAVERGYVGLFDIVTLPASRRRGAARRLVGALLDWATANGAAHAYLQVVAANDPAIALYRRLGFTELYRYHYRIAPFVPLAALREQYRTI